MPQTRILVFSTAVLAAAFQLAVAPAAFAQDAGAAAGAPPVSTPDATLDLTIPTGPAPGAAEATPKAQPRPAAKPAAGKKAPLKKTPASRFAGARRGLPALSSRGSLGSAVRGAATQATGTTQAPSMLGKLGVVRAGSATLRVDRTAGGRPLTIVSKGSNLAVVAEDATHYGVLMVDNTIGWIPKAHVELIDFDVQITLPPPTADGTVSAPTEQPVVEENNGPGGETVLEGLAPRTESLLREAFSYLGVPYVWAGNTRRGIDCSGFLKNVFSKHGVKLPRHSGDQTSVGVPVHAVEDLQPGDRLYFAMRGGRINHCGIYIGNGYFIHASSNQHKVGVDQIAKKNYWNGLVAARRDR